MGDLEKRNSGEAESFPLQQKGWFVLYHKRRGRRFTFTASRQFAQSAEIRVLDFHHNVLNPQS